jgi:glutamyl-tRNA reductase
MQDIASLVVSVADAGLGGLQGRSALLIGPQDLRSPYSQLLRQARMKNVFQEETAARLQMLLPHVQLVITTPAISFVEPPERPLISAASLALGCAGRRSPLLIFDLALVSSVEEMAGLLPSICLYTPEDIRHLLRKVESKAS